MPRVRPFVFVFLSLAVSSILFGQNLSITNYRFVSQQAISATTSQAVYRADLMNSGPALASATATVTSLVPNVQIVPGQGVLNFGPVGSGGQVTSSNTFTIQFTNGVPFSFSDLQWTFQSSTGPFANAGANQTVKVGSTVTLNGSGSTNPSGVGTLTYFWSFVSFPGGQAPSLFWPDRVMPTFTAATQGNYVIMLTVSNGVASNSSTVTVSTFNTPPVANAGPNQTVSVGATAVLNGSGSTSIDGRPLTYAWTFSSKPAGSTATLTGATTVNPTFVVDKAGSYVVQLIVNDGLASAPATVTVSTSATQPVANAGSNQVVNVGALVQLNGSGSTDANGLPLTYQWSLITLPSGSAAVLSNPAIVNPTFVADKAGTYVAQLIVNNGVLSSAAATVTINTSSPLAPTANAGPNQTVNFGSTVFLNGSGTDPQNLPLTYSWSLSSKPAGSAAVLSSAIISNPTFVADKAGTYIAQLIVNNGTLSSAPSTVTISTTCAPPTANAGPNQSVGVGATVTLNGSGSGDVCNDPLTYSWSFTTRPAGSNAVLSGATTVSPTFVTDVAGTYVAQLIVNNGFSNSTPATVTITAASATLLFQKNPLNLTNAVGILNPLLPAPAPAGGQLLNLVSSNPAIASVPATATVPAGAMSVDIPVTPGNISGTAYITVTAPGVGSGTATVNVNLPSITITLDTDLIGLTKTINGTFTLSTPAVAGAVVALSAAPAGIVTLQPSSVTIFPGGTSGVFTVTGVALGSVTITASTTGYTNGTAPATVAGLGVIKLTPGVTVGPNQSVSFPVSLALPAPTGGATIALSSSDTSKVTVTPSVFIPGGLTSPLSPAQVTGVNFGTANITASASGFTSDTKSVQVTGTLSFTDPLLVLSNSTTNLELNLSAPAPAGGVVVNLSSSDTSKATVPPTVTFNPFINKVFVPLTALAGGAVTIHASALPNLADTALNVNILAFGQIGIPANVSVPLSQSVVFTVNLPSPAPPGGTTITLTSSNSSIVSVTPSVFVPYNATVPVSQPQVTGNNIGAANITASAPGFVSATQTVKVPATLSFSPTSLSLSGGATQNLTLNLSAPAPLSGLTVNLSSDNPSIATVPPTVTFSAAATSVPVPVTGVGGGATLIHASALPSVPDTSATINVTSVGSIGIPASVALTIGQTVIVPVTLSKAAPSTTTVSLSTSDGSKVTVSPASIVIPAGSTTSVTPVQVTGISGGSATITASAPTWSSGSMLATVGAGSLGLPAGVTVAPGQSAVFTVTLSTPAPAGGVTVALVSNDTSKVTISPASVFIPQGSSLSSQAQVTGVSNGSATITASASGWNSASQVVQVATSTGTMSFSPSSATIAGTGTKTFSLILSAPAASGLTVNLSSTNPGVATVQPTASFAAGSSTAVVTVTGISAGSTTIIASAPGYSNASANVTVTSPPIIVPASTVVAPGKTVSFPVTLANPAGAGGVLISLAVADTSKATIWPGNVYIAQGATAPTSDGVAILTGIVAGTTTITASSAGYPSAIGQIVVGNAAPVLTMSFSPANLAISAGSSGNLTLILAGGTAPAGGLAVTLSSSNTSAATIQASATIPAGGTSVTVPVTGVAAGSSTITASASSIASTTAGVTVSGGGGGGGTSSFLPSSLSVSVGSVGNLTLNLSAAAPAGLIVSLTSSNPGVATVTSSVNFPANATSFTIPVTAVAAGTTTITATTPNFGTASAQVTVTAPTGIILASNLTVAPGGSISFPVTLGTAAGAGGVFISLAVSDGSKASLSQTNVYIPQGSTVPFVGGTPTLNGISAGPVTITASSSGYPTVSTVVQVGAAAPVNTLSFSPSSMSLNGAVTQTFTLLASTVASGVTVTLTSSNPGVASVPSTVTFGVGATSVAVPVTGVSSGAATISASATGFGSATAGVSVTGIGNTGLTMSFLQSRLILTNSTPQNATLQLSGPAPAGGLTVNLGSTDPGIATVPASVNIPANATSVSVPVTGVAPGKSYMNYPVTWYGKDTVVIQATATGVPPTATTATFFSTPSIVIPEFQWVGRGQTVPLPLSITSPAPAGGLTVTLTSDPDYYSVTPTVFIPTGATTPTTTPMITAGDLSPGGFSFVTAKAPNYSPASLDVAIGDHITIGLPTYNNILKGWTAPFPVVLPGLAPPGGATITLTSSDPTKVTITPSVFVPEGTNMPVAMPMVSGLEFGTADITAMGPFQYNGYIQPVTVR